MSKTWDLENQKASYNVDGYNKFTVERVESGFKLTVVDNSGKKSKILYSKMLTDNNILGQ